MSEIENNNNNNNHNKKQEKILNEEIKPNDAWALLSFFSKTWTAYNTIILWGRFPKVNINLTSKVQEI